MGTAGETPFRWHAELFSCKESIKDPGTTLWGIFFPSVLFARNVNRITDGDVPFLKTAFKHLAMGGCYCWCCCLPFYTAPFRERLRRKRNLPMDPFSDLQTHMFCHPCAICQEERELDSIEPPTVIGPSAPTIDRHPEDAKKHLEDNPTQQHKETMQAETMER